ncbi:MAG: Do family serine endopeptidase [Proteobacteria bacterium]|nr:Do family serine endopeptidase [Pseudomonadota bacterium]
MKSIINIFSRSTLLFLTLIVSLDAAFAHSETFSKIFKLEKEKVVHISTSAVVNSQLPQNPFYEQFFGKIPKKRRQSALGSGFIISSDGYIVTNNHVIDKADKVEVTLFNEKIYKAEVIGKDSQTDLALIKIDAKNLPVVKMGDSSKVEIGDWLVAIGNPLGLDHTITAGILSARSRDIFNGIGYGKFLQTDAAINPGNSGGPLYNMAGEVIGINAAIVAGGQGLGFAIPSNLSVKIIEQLKNTGKVQRGWLGVGIQNVSHELAESFGLPSGTKGVALTSIGRETPAQRAGLKQGDVIVQFGDIKIGKTTELQLAVAETLPGDIAKVKLYRDGKIMYMDILVGLRPSGDLVSLDSTENKYGLRLIEVTPETKQSLNLQQDYGLVVYELDTNGTAYEKGLRRKDVIIEGNRKKLKTLQDFYDAVETSKKKSQPLTILVVRNGRPIFMALPTE